MPQLGSNRKKGAGSIRERSAGHYEFRYYDKATRRQAVRTFVAPRPEQGASIRAARATLAGTVGPWCARYRPGLRSLARRGHDSSRRGPPPPGAARCAQRPGLARSPGQVSAWQKAPWPSWRRWRRSSSSAVAQPLPSASRQCVPTGCAKRSRRSQPRAVISARQAHGCGRADPFLVVEPLHDTRPGFHRAPPLSGPRTPGRRGLARRGACTLILAAQKPHPPTRDVRRRG